MNLTARYLIKILEGKGYFHLRTKGSHHNYLHSENGKLVVEPFHGNKYLPKGTFFAILKQAGIDKNEI